MKAAVYVVSYVYSTLPSYTCSFPVMLLQTHHPYTHTWELPSAQTACVKFGAKDLMKGILIVAVNAAMSNWD